MKGTVRTIMSEELACGLLFLPAVAIAALLGGGTERLARLGLTDPVAGGVVLLLVYVASVGGLYWFGTRIIDW